MQAQGNKQLPAQARTVQEQSGAQLPALSASGEAGGAALVLRTPEDMMRVAKILADAGLIEDIKSANQAFVKLMYGLELGMTPGEAIDDLYFLKGRRGIWARAIAAKFGRHGHYNYDILETTEECCTIQITYDGQPKGQPVTFTVRQAQEMGLLGKPAWKADRKLQLFYKALTRAQVMYAPDLYRRTVKAVEDLEDQILADNQAMLQTVGTRKPRAKDKAVDQVVEIAEPVQECQSVGADSTPPADEVEATAVAECTSEMPAAVEGDPTYPGSDSPSASPFDAQATMRRILESGRAAGWNTPAINKYCFSRWKIQPARLLAEMKPEQFDALEARVLEGPPSAEG